MHPLIRFFKRRPLREEVMHN